MYIVAWYRIGYLVRYDASWESWELGGGGAVAVSRREEESVG